ncbi:MAG: hypothetical protein M0Q91_05460 [Methanoregula sp.]|nr:hypothetical protein [Methanoregula sp.]
MVLSGFVMGGSHLVQSDSDVRKTSELPRIIPPLPVGDTTDLKTWREYWAMHDITIRKDERDKVLVEILEFVGCQDMQFKRDLVLFISQIRSDCSFRTRTQEQPVQQAGEP